MNILVETMHGLGDTIYQRPFIRELKGRVYVKTPWPQLFHDMDHVICCETPTAYRTQSKNRGRFKLPKPPRLGVRKKSYTYHPSRLNKDNNIINALGKLGKLQFDLPLHPDWTAPAIPGKFVLVRPPTIRKEWPTPARNPDTETFRYIVNKLRKKYTIVGVADLCDTETIVDKSLFRESDILYLNGELTLENICVLMSRSVANVSGVGFFAPLSVALKVNTLIVYGGCGGANSPEVIFDNRMTHKLTGILPDNICNCYDYEHDCDKSISKDRLDQELESWMNNFQDCQNQVSSGSQSTVLDIIQ